MIIPSLVDIQNLRPVPRYSKSNERKPTNSRKLPNIRLHTHPIISMFPQKRQPQLLRLCLSIPNLNQSPHRPPLEVLLTLLVDETASRNRPALYNTRERNGTVSGESEVVGCAEGKVGEEFEVADAVGTQLEVAGWDAVGGCSAEGA